jgi:hypothetical protein
MTVSQKPVIGTTLAVAAATPTQPAVLLPDNCHTIMVENTSNNLGYIAFVPNAGSFVIANAGVLPAGYREFSVRELHRRVRSGDPSIGPDLLFFNAGAGGTTLQITYVCGQQS